MVRIFNAYFPARTLLLGVSEALVGYAALVVATSTRFRADNGPIISYGNDWFRLAIVCIVCMLCMYYYDLYASIFISGTRALPWIVAQVVGTTCIVLGTLYYFCPSLAIRISLFVPGVVFMGCCLLVWRALFSALNGSRRFMARTVILGGGPLALPIAVEIESRPELGCQLVGFVAEAPESPAGLNGFRCIGDIRELPKIMDKEKVNRIIITMGDRRGTLPLEELLELKAHGVTINDGIDFYEAATCKMYLGSPVLSQLLFSKGFRVSRIMLVFKHVFSFLFSLVLLILAIPLMGLVAVGIWLDSGWPILFRQKRVGKDGRVFTLFKFRSMKLAGNVNGRGNGEPQPTQLNDVRFTSVGRWIRRLRVDELPQLYNILRGDMDFVGPRPFMLEEEHELARQIPYYKQRWTVRPGATGWAQVHRAYCATLEDNIDKLSYDLFYIKNMSIGLDLLIVFQTVKVLLCGRGAR